MRSLMAPGYPVTQAVNGHRPMVEVGAPIGGVLIAIGGGLIGVVAVDAVTSSPWC